MERLYRGHRIEILVGLDGVGWNISLRVFFQKGAAHTLEIFTINERFERYDRAVEAGITAARNWVDTKLRDCSKTSKLCAHSRRLREESRVIQQTLRNTFAKSRTIVDESLALYQQMRLLPALRSACRER
jgi:hypothetical protein